MSSIYEPLLVHLLLSKKVAVPTEDFKLESFKGSWYRFAKGNLLVTGKMLDITTEVRPMGEVEVEVYIIKLKTKPPKTKVAFTVIEEEPTSEQTNGKTTKLGL